MDSWFSDLHLWEEGSIPQERLAWVEIDGLPIEAWKEINFRNVAAKFGRVLEVDEVAFEGSMNTSVGALVLTKHMEDLNEVVEVEVLNRKVKVKVVEDHNRSLLLQSEHSYSDGCFSAEGDPDDILDTDDNDSVKEVLSPGGVDVNVSGTGEMLASELEQKNRRQNEFPIDVEGMDFQSM